jgi:hypothetical protein
MSFAAKHRVEDHKQLAHARRESPFGVLTSGPQLQIKGSDDRIAADSRDRLHVKDAPDLGASAQMQRLPRRAPLSRLKGARPASAAIWLAIQRSQFRQLRQQRSREHLADPRHGTQQFVTLTPQRRLANHGAKLSVKT